MTYRPDTFSGFTGQPLAVELLSYAIDFAKEQSRACGHILLSGPPGLGKTTLARIVAKAMGSNTVFTSGPALENQEQVIACLRQLKPNDVLFVDEVHSMPRIIAERIYPAMEDGVIELFMGEYIKRSKLVRLPPFTLIGATTHPGAIPKPMRDRFKNDITLELYDVPTLIEVLNKAGCPNDWREPIAKRSRGTPRIALKLYELCQQVKNLGNAFRLAEIDDDGLNAKDRRYLRTIIEAYSGGPVGIAALAASLGDETANLADITEPYLLQQGYVARTKRGRMALPKAYAKLGINPNQTTDITDGALL